jgi:hypothetical protein
MSEPMGLRHLCSRLKRGVRCSLCPGFGRDVFDLPIGHRGQAREDILKVTEGINAAPPAVFDDGVDDGAAFTGCGLAYEQPVFLAHGGGTYGIFDQIVVYALQRRRWNPGSNPGGRPRSSPKHWERFRR